MEQKMLVLIQKKERLENLQLAYLLHGKQELAEMLNDRIVDVYEEIRELEEKQGN